jgi:hypothetical protein
VLGDVPIVRAAADALPHKARSAAAAACAAAVPRPPKTAHSTHSMRACCLTPPPRPLWTSLHRLLELLLQLDADLSRLRQLQGPAPEHQQASAVSQAGEGGRTQMAVAEPR